MDTKEPLTWFERGGLAIALAVTAGMALISTGPMQDGVGGEKSPLFVLAIAGFGLASLTLDSIRLAAPILWRKFREYDRREHEAMKLRVIEWDRDLARRLGR